MRFDTEYFLFPLLINSCTELRDTVVKGMDKDNNRLSGSITVDKSVAPR